MSIWCLVLVAGCSTLVGQKEDDRAVADRSELNVLGPAHGDQNSTSIHVNADLVTVPVTVTDRKGVVVNGLRKEQFSIYEDKTAQEITHFTSEDAPISLGFVVDTSDSMEKKLPMARAAVAALLDKARSEDEFFLVQFDSRPQLLISTTTRTAEIRNGVANLRTAGATALLDAVVLALDQMTRAHQKRKAIIIISDGEDNMSRCSIPELKQLIRETDTLIYAISRDLDTGKGSALLNEIAAHTGGRLLEAKSERELPRFAAKINTWLRNQYLLAYQPTNSTAGYHHIQIKITRPSGFPRLHAFWRLGYYTPPE